MKRFSEQLQKQANNVRLSAADKSDLKSRLEAYMEYHPLPAERTQKAPSSIPELVSEPFALVKFNTVQFRSLIGVFAVLMVILVPAVAERAVPGDVLYPIKVQFNEEVRSKLSFSPYQKVEWETTRLERRIAEARLLASEGKLTDEVESEVAKAVKSHSDAAKKEIATIAETDSDEAALAGITFSAALEVQSEVLESDTEKGILNSDVVEAVSEARKTDPDQELATPSYEKLLARIETETTNATEFFNSINEVASDSAKADIERRLADIGRKVDKAILLHEEEAEESLDESVELLIQSLADTRKLISFMTDIDVKESVSVEELVPVTLTLEERIAKVKVKLVSVEERQPNLIALSEMIVDESLAEKIALGFEALDEAVAVASSSMTETDINTAEITSQEALNIIQDIERILEVSDIEKPEPSEVEAETSTSTEEVIGESEEETASTTDDGTEVEAEFTETDEEVETEKDPVENNDVEIFEEEQESEVE